MAGLEHVAEYGGEDLARGDAGAAGGARAGAADGDEGADVMGTTMDDPYCY